MGFVWVWEKEGKRKRKRKPRRVHEGRNSPKIIDRDVFKSEFRKQRANSHAKSVITERPGIAVTFTECVSDGIICTAILAKGTRSRLSPSVDLSPFLPSEKARTGRASATIAFRGRGTGSCLSISRTGVYTLACI
jgi:hypothetical protein